MDLHHLLLAGLPAHSALPRSADIVGLSGPRMGWTGRAPAIVATVNEGHSLSEHAQPLSSVHANRTSGTTR